MNDNVRVYHVDEYCEGASHFSFSERKDVVLLEDYKELQAENKHLEDYIDAYQKSEAINIAKLDEKDERIKELELALSNSREHEKALRKCFDNHRQRIKELEATISKMETVKDVLPQWGKLVKIKFKDGKEDERRFSADYSSAGTKGGCVNACKNT